MIALVVALDSEAKSFLDKIQNKKEFLIAGKKTYSGTVANKDVVLSICGVGKVNAGLATQLLIDKYSPEYIVNFGTAGGMNSTVKVKDYYLINECAQYDFDLSYLDPVPVGYIQDYQRVLFPTFTDKLDFLPESKVASGDRFNDDTKDVATILNMGCTLRDMEGGAIAQVCLANQTKLVMVKGVSDVYGAQTATEQFLSNLHGVSEGFADIIERVIKAL